MRYRTTVVFFAVAVTLAAAYFLYVGPAMEEKRLIEDFQKRFFLADPRDIDFIRLDAGDGPVDIAQRPSGWMVIRPGEYMADQGVVNKFLETLANGRLLKVVGSAEDAGRFGIEKPQIVIGLAFADKLDVLSIGDRNPASTGYYAYSERLGRVFLVNKEFVKGIYLKLYDLREKRLFHFEPKEIERIRIKRPKDTVELVKRDGSWRMLSPLAGRVDAREVEGLIEVLFTQKAEEFLERMPELDGPEHILLEITGKGDGRIASADVYFWGKGGNRGALVHSPGSEEATRTRRDFWLLLEGESSAFMYRNVLDVDSERVKTIRFSWDGESHLFEKKGGRWFSNGAAVDADRVASMIKSLNSWKAKKLIREERFLGKKQFRVEVEAEGGVSTLEVSNFNMDHEVSTSGMFVHIDPGRPGTEKVDYWFARSSNLDYAAIVSSLELKKIKEQIEGLADE